MMKIQRCKGTRDLTPDEMAVFRFIEGVFTESSNGWGYKEVRTPTIEYLHLFTSAGTLTPGMLGRVYSFLDWDGWSGERVVLRPDGTIPVARMYIDSIKEGPARLCYVSNIFAFNQDGRKSRERWQCGAELIGSGSALADAELVLLSLDVLRKLGLENLELRLSHAGLLKALLGRLEISQEEKVQLLDRILDGDLEALAKVRPAASGLDGNLVSLFNLSGQSSGFLKNMKALCLPGLPDVCQGLDEFISVVSLLEAAGVRYRIDITSGAGFEYYTGIIFQLYCGEDRVGGGGRYDDLIPAMGGGRVPASGFALYLDRLMNLVKTIDRPPAGLQLRTGTGDMKKSLDLAAELRRAGMVVEIDLGGQPRQQGWRLETEGDRFFLYRPGAPPAPVGSTEEVLAVWRQAGAGQDCPA